MENKNSNSEELGSTFPQFPQFPQAGKSGKDMNTPVFSDFIFQHLPDQLKRLCDAFTNEREKDIILIGAITTISSFINDLSSVYNKAKVYSNLYLFVVAPPSSGKGILKNCRYLAQPVHDHFKGNPEDGKSPKRMFILPGNNSSTGIYQLLNENNGVGLLIETEGDTLSNSFKQDFGDFSSGLRDAFHHETIAYNRRKDNERVEIDEPRLSVILSGTPLQVKNLIPSTENGLFSRFIYYTFEAKPTFDNVFENTVESDLKQHFQQIGLELFEFYKDDPLPVRDFVFSISQQSEFQEYFQHTTDRLTTILKGSNIIAIIRRMGLIFYRIAMILTYLRNLKNNKNTIECSSTDFSITKEIIDVLIEHSIVVLDYLPKQDSQKFPVKNEQVYNMLPNTFSRKEYLEEARKLSIPEKTIDGYISRLLGIDKIKRISQGKYEKIIP